MRPTLSFFLFAFTFLAVIPAVAVGSPLTLSALDWEQAAASGFGVPGTPEITALEVFDGYLYAGTHNPVDPEPLFDGTQIFRSSDGMTWTSVTEPGFGNPHDTAPPAILDFVIFNGRLYAGTGRGNASQVWRTQDGTIWAPMDVTGFSDPDNVNVTGFAVYGGLIYAGVTNQVTGAQIWRSFTGDNHTWVQVAPAVPGTIPSSVTGFAEFNGGLYAAVEIEEETPAQIWRSYGGPWETAVSDGFGNPGTIFTGGMAVFLGDLYVGAGNIDAGAQLWRSVDGDLWTQAITPGLGDANNEVVELVAVYQGQLYVSVRNSVTGIEIWRTVDGSVWEQLNTDGFGDANNTGTNRSNASAEFLGPLYQGTLNLMGGGELWRTVTATGIDVGTDMPGFALRAATPNPFRYGCHIAFDLPRDGSVSLDVFDVSGRLVRRLARETVPAGSRQVHWDGADDAGQRVAPGLYYYRLRAGAFEAARSVVVMP